MKTLKSLTAFFIATICLTNSAYGYDFCEDNIYYNFLDDGGVEVTHNLDELFSGPSYHYAGDVIIPSTLSSNGATVTSIGWAAFFHCVDLKSVTLPNTIKTIKSGAFDGCSSLTSITVPESVTKIGTSAFECSNLAWLKMKIRDPRTLDLSSGGTFQLSSPNCTLYVPRGSKDLYDAMYVFSLFASIVEYDDEAEERPDYELTADNILARNGRVTMLPISMNNVGGIVSFQCDVTLPDGVTVQQEDGV